MSLSSMRSATVRVLSIVVAAGIGFALASSPSYAQQEEQWRLFVTAPENVRTVWFLQARHVASELELERQDRGKLMRIYSSARQEHLDKIKALPETQESFRKFRDITTDAKSSLEKSLVEALGEKKGKEAAVALGGFNFFFDHIMADILAAQNKAVGSLLKYEQVFNKVLREAQETGTYEGVPEKLEGPTRELMSGASAIYSEGQLAEWEEKYGWLFERILSP